MAEVLQIPSNSYGVEQGLIIGAFGSQPVDLTWDSTKHLVYLPINSIGSPENRHINFFIPRWLGRQFLDFSDVKLGVQIELLTKDDKKIPDGTAVTTTANVAPLNNVVQSMFAEQHVYLNNVPLTNDGSHHWIKRLLETMTGWSSAYKNTVLQSDGWYPDDKGTENETILNNGFKERMQRFCTLGSDKLTKDWHPSWFWSTLQCDYNWLIPNGVDVRIELVLNPPKLYLMSNDAGAKLEYKYAVRKAQLEVPVKVMSKSVINRFEEKMKGEMFNRKYRRSTVTPFVIADNQKVWLSNNLFPSPMLIPYRAALVIMSEDAYLGNYTKNPYLWNYKIESDNKSVIARLTLNGESLDGLDIEDQPELDFRRLYDVLGMTKTGDSFGIGLDQFMKGMYPYIRAVTITTMMLTDRPRFTPPHCILCHLHDHCLCKGSLNLSLMRLTRTPSLFQVITFECGTLPPAPRLQTRR